MAFETTGRAFRQLKLTAILLLVSLPAFAQTPDLRLMATGTGLPGGTVGAQLRLGNVANRDVVEVFADLRFDASLLSLEFSNCSIAENIESSYVLEGEAGAGNVQLSVLPEPESLPLAAGTLATCVFEVDPGIVAGTTARLTFADARVLGSDGNALDLITQEGVIIISVETPPPTPTRTVGPTFTVRSASAPSDCSVVPPGQAHPLGSWLLLGGAALLLIRRRR